MILIKSSCRHPFCLDFYYPLGLMLIIFFLFLDLLIFFNIIIFILVLFGLWTYSILAQNPHKALYPPNRPNLAHHPRLNHTPDQLRPKTKSVAQTITKPYNPKAHYPKTYLPKPNYPHPLEQTPKPNHQQPILSHHLDLIPYKPNSPTL